jgi:hypothetical protein
MLHHRLVFGREPDRVPRGPAPPGVGEAGWWGVGYDIRVVRVDLSSMMESTASGAADAALDVRGALRSTAARGDAVAARWADRLIGRR